MTSKNYNVRKWSSESFFLPLTESQSRIVKDEYSHSNQRYLETLIYV